MEWDLYFITDSGLSANGVVEDVRLALRAGCRAIQYREKMLPDKKMLKVALELKSLCAGKADFIVNDRLGVALACGADGLHLGQGDIAIGAAREKMPGAIIGISAHSLSQAIAAQDAGASYIGIGPVFATETKKDAGAPLGTAAISDAQGKIRIPIVAIGGISNQNVAEVINAGAGSAAMISAIICGGKVYENAKAAISAIRGAKGARQNSE